MAFIITVEMFLFSGLIISVIKYVTDINKRQKEIKKLNANLIDKKEEYSGYPTKEEFEENVRQINENELKSNKFKTTKEFISLLNERKNLELEEQLFQIVKAYELEKDLINESYEHHKASYIKIYNELKKFMNSLTPEQINSNQYLTAAAKFMETSSIDCKIIIEALLKDLKNYDKTRSFELYVDVPEERLDLFPKHIMTSKAIPYYKPEAYRMASIDLLDKNNRHIYKEYNNYAEVISKLAATIYHLQMWNLLSVYPEQIYNYYFGKEKRENKCQFHIMYSVEKQGRKKKMDSYQLEPKTYDLSLKIDDIPMDGEHIITIEQVNEIPDGPTLIIKKQKKK